MAYGLFKDCSSLFKMTVWQGIEYYSVIRHKSEIEFQNRKPSIINHDRDTYDKSVA
jgi:hypothetical protein